MKNRVFISCLILSFCIQSYTQSLCDKLRDSINVAYTNRPFVGTVVVKDRNDTLLIAQYGKEGNVLFQRLIAQGSTNTLQKTFFNASTQQYKTRTYIPITQKCSDWTEGGRDTAFQWLTPTIWHKINQLTLQTPSNRCGRYLDKRRRICY